METGNLLINESKLSPQCYKRQALTSSCCVVCCQVYLLILLFGEDKRNIMAWLYFNETGNPASKARQCETRKIRTGSSDF